LTSKYKYFTNIILTFTDILLGGFGLFGGRGEYVGKIKLFDIGTEGGDQEGDGDLLSESDEIAYECGARQKYPILFDEAVTLHSGRWYVLTYSSSFLRMPRNFDKIS
jgi:hypothetical protein